MDTPFQYKISTLVFIKNAEGKLMLVQRLKSPNKGLWSPIGGKLEMSIGESPFQCAIRETREETGLELTEKDLHLFAIVAEKAYEGNAHWLMFLFDCKKAMNALPPEMGEGRYEFFDRSRIDSLSIPETDRKMLWSTYDNFSSGFCALRADCEVAGDIKFTIEQSSK